MDTHFGDILRRWRSLRRLSQLELGLRADVSARHINFIERGRARPSRAMVGLLARTLEMSKPQANLAALAAGHAPIYKEHSSDADLAPLKRSIDIMLENHMPLPGIVLDRHWNVIRVNEAARCFLKQIGFSGFANLIEALTTQSPAESSIENWHESVALVLYRLQAELTQLGEEPILHELQTNLEHHFLSNGGKDTQIDFRQSVLPTRFHVADRVISVFSTIARFGTVFDLNLSDLQVELMFPCDLESETHLEEICQATL